MIKIALVAGDLIDRMDAIVDVDKVEVVHSYRTVADFWNDAVERGSAAFTDIDKIIVLYTGFLVESEMSYEEQMVNLQGFMSVAGMKTPLYVIANSSDLHATVDADRDKYVMYEKFALMTFSNVKTKIIMEVIQGERDGFGVQHPDFSKVEEDEMLDEEKEDVEEEVEEVEEEEEFDGYADSEENNKEVEKRKKEKRQEERRLEREKAKEKAKEKANEKNGNKGLLGKWFGNKGEEKGTDKKEEVGKEKKKKREKKKESNSDMWRKGVIAFTGDRQSGVSTTVANVAEVYAEKGNSVMVIDLDIKRRFLSKYYEKFGEEVERDSRVSYGLLVSLLNQQHVEDVYALVKPNIGLLALDDELERPITRFGNKDIENVFNAPNLISLLSFAKAQFDVVLVDFPFELMDEIGDALTYVDRVVLCSPNTGYHLDTLMDLEMSNLLMDKELVGHSLLAKSVLMLTKYSSHSKILGKEVSERFVEDLLESMDDYRYEIELVGKISYQEDYEDQFDKGKSYIKANKEFYEEVVSVIEQL